MYVGQSYFLIGRFLYIIQNIILLQSFRNSFPFQIFQTHLRAEIVGPYSG